jgi:hypothetical protein
MVVFRFDLAKSPVPIAMMKESFKVHILKNVTLPLRI